MTDHTPMPDPTEARLRAALAAEADSIEPSPDGLRHIEERLMSPTISRNQRFALGGVAAVILLIIGAVFLFGGDDDDPAVVTGPTTSSTTTSSTTSSSTTSTTEGNPFTTTFDPAFVVFPAADSSQRFESPETVARAFLTQYAEFTDPQVSEFQQGDSRSGEFVVTRNGSGPESIILVRQLDDETWGVIGAVSEQHEPAVPADDALVSSPLAVSGDGLAFEGTINVDVREQGRTESIGEGFVTAAGTPPLGPYSESIEFSPPATETGAVMFREFSAEDGTTSWVSVTRVRFADSGTDGPSALGDCESDSAGAGEILVFFSCSTPTDGFELPVSVVRPAPADDGVLRAALESLLDGPTSAEQSRDLTSPFPIPGGGATVSGVTIAEATATVDLAVDRDDLLATGETLFGMLLVDQIFRTATQFPTVEAVEVHFNGSCSEFADWAQADGCIIQPVNPPDN